MRVGILGGGQLGRMLALDGCRLGLGFRAFDPAEEVSAAQVCEHFKAGFSDRAALAEFARGLDVVTYEWENVPLEAAREVQKLVPFFFPDPSVLEVVQDRLYQKEYLRKLGVPTAPFESVSTRLELEAAVGRIGLPAVLKTRRMGYDGKGQFVLRAANEVEAAWKALGGVPLVLESFIAFEREVSIVAARGRAGGTVYYPVAENRHREGILRLTLAPAPNLTPALQAAAEVLAKTVLEAFGYVGVLTIELFEIAGRLVVNEVATRVHNSGHWTIEGAETSQFENHLRAGLGLPLGSTKSCGPVAMLNLIGTMPSLESVLRVPGAHFHSYGKEPKAGRKLGHITVAAGELPRLLAAVGSAKP